MRWLGATLAVLFLAANAEAASIHARLIRASTEPAAQDERLKEIEPKLKVFGYSRYQQLGAQKGQLKENEQLKLNLGEGFVVFVRPISAKDKTHELEVELTSGRASVVKATSKIAEKSTLIIKGPEVGSTLILVALTVLE